MTTSVTIDPWAVGCTLVESNSRSIAQVAHHKWALQRKAKIKKGVGGEDENLAYNYTKYVPLYFFFFGK